MTNDIKNLSQELKELLASFNYGPIASKHIARIENGNLTIQENPESHFCIYFAAYDNKNKELFIGHHKKSGLWLFNGGHIDEGEIINETLGKEIDEEWGLNVADFKINKPALLTITDINNPTKQTCRSHYDIWYFISVNKDSFHPKQEGLAEEFHETGWKNIEEAKSLVKDKNTLKGIKFIADNYF